MSQLLLGREQPKERCETPKSPELVPAETKVSKKPNTYLVNGIAVAEASRQERLRGAQELHRVISEISRIYSIAD